MKTAVKTWVATCLVAAVVACTSEDVEPGPKAQPPPAVETSPAQVQPLATDCTSVISLSNHQKITGLSGGAGTWSCIFKLNLPTGATRVSVRTGGGYGDVSLFMRRDAAPTSTQFNCAAYTDGTTTESCFFESLEPGTYYVRLYGRTDYLDVELLASYLENGCTLPLEGATPNLTMSAGYSSCVYTLDVPVGAYDLRFRTLSGTGDPDLYVRHESTPQGSYDCVARGSHVPERCNFMAPLPGTYYVQVYASTNIENVQFMGAYSAGQPCTWRLENGETVEDVGASGGTTPCLYTLEVPEGATRASFVTRGPGSFDLFVGRDYVPNEDLNECMSRTDFTSDESCFIENPQPGTYYLRPYADLGTAEVRVHANFCPGPMALSNGTAVDNLSGWKGEGSCLYTVEVPAGATNLRLSTSGGTGDADLYVKSGAAPTTTVNDCESEANGNSERCRFEAPQPGTYYVRLRGSSDYSGLGLKARYCTDPVPLSNGVPMGGIDAWSDTWACTHSIEVPEGATRLEVTLSNTGVSPFFIQRGSAPTSSTYDCRSSGNGNLQSCVITMPVAGTYYIRPYAYSDFSGATLTATYTTNPAAGCTTIQPLSNGVPVTNISAPAEGWSCLYTLAVPYGSKDVVISTSGGTGNADLFVQEDAEPGAAADCISAGPGNTETCSFRSPNLVIKYYVRLYGQSAFSGVTLKATFTPPLPMECTTIYPLSNGTSVGNLAAPYQGWSCIYTLQVPAGAQQLEFSTSGGTGDGDLFVKFGATPSQSAYDCKSTGGTSTERCVISQPREGTYYVRMYGYSAFSGVSLKGSFTAPSAGCTTNIPLTSGVAVRNISVEDGGWSCVYTLTVPSNAIGATFVTSGGTGDVDLYVKYGAVPTTSQYDCASKYLDNSEQCIISTVRAGTYYVRLKGYEPSAGISLTGSYIR